MKTGEVVGKYRIQGEIGRGSTGVVYLAEDLTLARRVALKVLDRAVTADERVDVLLRQEARVVASLNHPNVVQIYALEWMRRQLAIAMAYIDGGSMAAVQAAGQMVPSRAVRHFAGILSALVRCHEAGIVHRDIKPSNILIAVDDRAMLSDFGLSRVLAERQTAVLRESRSSNFFVGTPRYAPPEAWDGLDPTPAWDVYSAGMVLYEAIAQRLPYVAATPLALMKQLVEHPILPLSEVTEGISPPLCALVGRMLDREPSIRPKASEALTLLRATPEITEEPVPTTYRHVGAIRQTRSMARAGIPIKRAVRLLGLTPAVAALTVIAVFVGSWVFAPTVLNQGVRFPATRVSDSVILPNSRDFDVFDILDTESQAISPASLLLRYTDGNTPRDEFSPFTCVAFNNTRLVVLRSTSRKDGSFIAEGHWAEYADDTARVFRHGSVKGAGRWHTLGEDAVVSLQFVCAQDGSQRTSSVYLKRTGENVRSVDFLRRFESTPAVSSLMYNELLPRHLEWVSLVEHELFTLGTTRVIARYVGAKGDSALQLDGRLSEVAWSNVSFDNVGVSGGLSESTDSSPGNMFACYDISGVYIGLRVEKPLTSPQVILTLTPRFSVPLSDSPVFSVRIASDNSILGRYVVYGRESAWQCSWQATNSNADDAWELELFIPFSNLDAGGAPPIGTRWRFNCQVTDGEGFKSTTVAQWGCSDFGKPHHGVVLIFE